jgi:hypothetical protein
MQDEKRGVRVKRLGENDDLELFRNTTPAERIDMMWQLTLDAWAAKGEPITNPKMDRSVVRVVRQIPVLGRSHLIANKRAVGRPQDLADAARLEALS